MTETELQSLAYERLSWEPGLIPFRFNCGKIAGRYNAVTWGRHRAHAGVPDLAVLVGGRRMIWIEIKTPTGSHRASQRDFAAVIRDAGGDVYTARSMGDIENIIRLIKGEYHELERSKRNI